MRKKTVIGLVLLAFCLVFRFYTPAADFYAERLYPAISGGLSWLGSLTRFSLEEIVVVAFLVTFVDLLVKAIKKKVKFLSWLGKTLVVVMWLYVWVYMGWANNYYRTGLYQRNGIQRVAYDEETFSRFLENYTDALNLAASEAGDYDRDVLEADVKSYLSKVAAPYGYAAPRRWQHVKRPLLNRLYSAVGVLGFAGPFFCESQVNGDVLENEYPYTAAHELAHLAGVTGEAEASWWGFDYCRQSGNAAVRYSGYLSMLPYVLSNAGRLLSEEDYAAWTDTLSGKVKADYLSSREHWQSLRVGWIDRLQSRVFNLFLKSNGVSEGTKDYFGVVGMIITMDASRQTIEI